MRYKETEKAVFLKRPNRFIAEVEIQGKRETVHVKNTGRCAELLKAGATVYVQKSDKEERKTASDSGNRSNPGKKRKSQQEDKVRSHLCKQTGEAD